MRALKINKPKDLPKVEGKPETQWLNEIHFGKTNGVVTVIIHPPGKPQFPIYQGTILAPSAALSELFEACK